MSMLNLGGGKGCMGALNEACRLHGGEIVGVLHETFLVDGNPDSLISDMIMAKGPNLSERKNLLLAHSDCIIVLPGGVGTLDELWDTVCQKSLRMNGIGDKPICLLNYDGYFDGSILQLQRAGKEGLLYHELDKYFAVESTPSSALAYCVKQCS